MPEVPQFGRVKIGPYPILYNRRRAQVPNLSVTDTEVEVMASMTASRQAGRLFPWRLSRLERRAFDSRLARH